MESKEWNKLIIKQQRLARICRICEKRFHPDGKFQKLCKDCFKKQLVDRRKNYINNVKKTNKKRVTKKTDVVKK